MLAPVRLGFTATVPKEGTEEAMALEGLIGPVIGEFDMEEAMEKEILAVPKVKLIAVPKNTNLQDLKTYKDIYRVGIVNNRMRNKAIARLLLSLKQEGKTTLVYINHLEHIQRVVDELDHSVQCEIVEGNVSIREREKIKASLLAKKIDVVIASTAWKEGINIPTVDYIVNAGGGKAEIAVLQIPGRGLRRAPGKEEAFIVDFLDQGRYLSEHMSERLNIYANKGWL
jgi:superfamily II DNA or RNA helicase